MLKMHCKTSALACIHTVLLSSFFFLLTCFMPRLSHIKWVYPSVFKALYTFKQWLCDHYLHSLTFPLGRNPRGGRSREEWRREENRGGKHREQDSETGSKQGHKVSDEISLNLGTKKSGEKAQEKKKEQDTERRK